MKFNLLRGLYEVLLSSVVQGGCYFGVLEHWEMFETAEGLLGETLEGKKKGRMGEKSSFFPHYAVKGKIWP